MNNFKDHFFFRHGPLMLGVKSVLGNKENEPVEISIPRDTEVKPLGGDRYEVDEITGIIRMRPSTFRINRFRYNAVRKGFVPARVAHHEFDRILTT